MILIQNYVFEGEVERWRRNRIGCRSGRRKRRVTATIAVLTARRRQGARASRGRVGELDVQIDARVHAEI